MNSSTELLGQSGRDKQRSRLSLNDGKKSYDPKHPILVKEMTMQFGTFKAVDKLTLSVKRGEIMSLLGHNGAGKTTAIYMLTGMLQPSEGDANLYGASVRASIDEVRKSIGLCQQFDVLYDDISIEAHLEMAYRIRTDQPVLAEEVEEIRRILQLVMLTEHKHKMVKECSGGMKRKLSLGLALIGATRTIILDEPTSGLDVESRRQVWNLIKKIKEDRSIIMSTQHIEEADFLSDRVCIMSHGKIIALDTPQNIKKRFGVGYNIFVEPRYAQQQSNEEIVELL